MSDRNTTIAAVVSAVFGFVAMFPEHFQHYPLLIDIAKFAHVGGLAALGISAADTKKNKG